MGEEVAVQEEAAAPAAKSDPRLSGLAHIVFLQVLMVFMFAFFADYADIGGVNSTSYTMFMDVHVMVFIGFGFLMTFMRRYSFSAVGFNMILACIAMQYSILIHGFFDHWWRNDWTSVIKLNTVTLITGDFAAACVLISFGAILGKARLNQLVVMLLLEIIFYTVNEKIGIKEYDAVDMGGSMFVHAFGAYFGLAVSYMITDNSKVESAGDRFVSSYMSDIFAMIGTLFLFVFWPSFNGAMASGAAQERVAINTVLSLSNSAVGAFLASRYFRPDHKLNMVDIQNATLAGGVAVGSSADLVIMPYAALTIGFVGGVVSVYGYVHIQPWLESKGVHDTCGVHNLHGLPGVIGGVGGAISAATMSGSLYSTDAATAFPAMAEGRTKGEQGGYQAAALVTTIAIAIGGGLITGKVMSLMPNDEVYGEDNENWSLEWEEENHEELKNTV